MKMRGWNDLDKRFGMGAGKLYSIFDDAFTSPDHHDVAVLIGDKIQKSKDAVWSIFVEEWCKHCLKPADAAELIAQIRHALPEGNDNA